MFLRTIHVKKDTRTYTYMKLVENQWVQGKVVQRVMVNFGNIDDWPPVKVKNFIKKLSEFYNLEPPTFVDETITHKKVLNYGQLLVCEHVWNELHVGNIIQQCSKQLKMTFDISLPVKIMVFNRLLNPRSKLKVSEWYKTQYFRETMHEEIPLHNFYRSLDYIMKMKESLELGLYNQVTDLFTLDLSLVFYDMTSSYFEGSRCPLSEYGYSRDHRPDRKQITIGLLVNREGIPLSHQVFQGNLKDTSTVPAIVSTLEKRFNIRRCIFVGDKGMHSPANIEYLVKAQYEYILSIKLHHSATADELIAHLPDTNTFEKVKDNLFVKELKGTTPVRFIACYNPGVAAATKQTRDAHLQESTEFLKELQMNPHKGKPQRKEKVKPYIERTLRKKGTLKFYTIEYHASSFEYSLNLEQLHKEEQRDGLFILQTNCESLSPSEIALGYKTLAEVEYAFKQVKDFIRLRPIYHYAQTRVEGHVFICFLSYLLEKVMYKQLHRCTDLKDAYKSPQKVLDTLEPIKVIIDEFEGHTFLKRTELTDEQLRLLQYCGINKIPSILN